MSEGRELPKSHARKRRSWLSAFWLAPVIAAALAGWMIYKKKSAEGPLVTVSFFDASGVREGKTDLMYKGVKMGQVEALDLSADKRRILVKVRLKSSAESFARAGSRFWIVRPEITAAAVTGLGTIVSGDYIGVRPGEGARRESFEGLEAPPVEKLNRKDLEIVLTASRLQASEKGTPVYYKGVKVGAVQGGELSKDARQVRIVAVIDEPYAPLVRANSVFWNAGGIKLDWGLFSGLEARAKSFTSLVSGALAFATPDPPGPGVKNGYVFPLQEKVKDEWQGWSPSIRIKPTFERTDAP